MSNAYVTFAVNFGDSISEVRLHVPDFDNNGENRARSALLNHLLQTDGDRYNDIVAFPVIEVERV